MKRIALLFVVLAGCAAPDSLECRRAGECPSGFCVSGRCVPLDAGLRDAGPFVRYLDVPFRSTDARSTPGPACRGANEPTTEHVILNEVLVNVPTGASGDANGDGVRDAYDDEFVELVNVSDAPVDLSRVQIVSGERVRYAFGAFCLPPGESVVVFGGGSVAPSIPGNVIVSPDRFSFGNDGGSIRLVGPAGLIGELDYTRAPPSAFVRSPELTDGRWTEHRQVGDLSFSPGRCATGEPFSTGCEPPDEEADASTDAPP